MAIDLDEQLGAFSSDDYSVRLVRTVCNVVPFAPELPAWFSLVDGLKELAPDAKRPVLERAAAIARTDDVQRALWVISALDTTDAGLGAFSGLASAYKLYQAKTGGERLDALDTDTQQGVDAVLKGLALALAVYKLYPGSLAEKVAAFRASTTGQAIVFYYASIEIGLPFTDNALIGGGTFVRSLFERFGPDQQAKLAVVAGPEEAAHAMTMMQQLFTPVETMVGMAREHLGGIASAAGGVLATAANVGDKVAGVAATGADLLPVYRFLGSRLVAEAVLRRALAEDHDDRVERVAASSAAVPVKYTRSADDLPDSPKRRGCFGVVLALLALGASAAAWAGTLP
jgi:hypothetical protein